MSKLIKKKLKNRNSKLFQWAKFVENKLPVSIQRLIYLYRYKYKKELFILNLSNKQSIFTNIYKLNYWESQESKSGRGSTLKATTVIREQLPLIIEKYTIQSMLDVPCGDYNWMKAVKKTCNYIGGDIVAEAIENNQKLYASEKVQFRQIDITKDALPTVDLIFCKDCLQHLSDASVHKALANFKSSGSKYLLVTSYPKTWINHDIEDGSYRALNLRKSPFRLPKPILRVRESLQCGNEIDKSMYLYQLSDLIVKK
jgi:SAM-dependent methyltransferase